MARIPRTTAPTTSESTPTPTPRDRQGFTGKVQDSTDTTEASWDQLEIAPTKRHVYRMSALGGDLAQLVAGALGVAEGPMPGWLQPYLDEGTAAEPRILEMFHDAYDMRAANYQELATLKEEGVIAGYNALEEQVQVWLEVGTSALVRGHADEIVRVNPKGKEGAYAVVEAKKLRPTLWEKWTVTKTFGGDPVLAKYGWQVAALFWSTMLPVYFVVGQWDVDEQRVASIDVTMLTEKNVPYTLAQLKARVMKAESHVKKGVVPQCEMLDDACVYGAEDFCLGKPEVEFEDLDDVDLGKLLGLHYAYGIDMQLDDDQKEAKKLREAVKKQIDKYVADKGYARGAKYHVWDEAGNEFEFEWVQTEVEKSKFVTSYPKIKVIGELSHDAPEDDA